MDLEVSENENSVYQVMFNLNTNSIFKFNQFNLNHKFLNTKLFKKRGLKQVDNEIFSKENLSKKYVSFQSPETKIKNQCDLLAASFSKLSFDQKFNAENYFYDESFKFDTNLNSLLKSNNIDKLFFSLSKSISLEENPSSSMIYDRNYFKKLENLIIIRINYSIYNYTFLLDKDVMIDYDDRMTKSNSLCFDIDLNDMVLD